MLTTRPSVVIGRKDDEGRGFLGALGMSGRYSATTRLHLSEPGRSGIGNRRATDVAYSSLRLLSPSFDKERLYSPTSQAQMRSRQYRHAYIFEKIYIAGERK